MTDRRERQALKKRLAGGPLNPPLLTGFRVLASTCPRCGYFWTTPESRWVIKPTDPPRMSRGACPRCRVNYNTVYRQRPDAVERDKERRTSPEGRRYDAEKHRKRNDRTREGAKRHRNVWTTAELTWLARHEGNDAEAATALGRTIAAIRNMRRQLRTDPRKAHAAEVATLAEELGHA